MSLKSALYAGIGLMALAAPALADQPRVYSYAASANHCPAGLQPITLNGVICCGTPNQSMSYQQAKVHPVARKKVVRKRVIHRARVICPVGEKGCYTGR
ncbi:MAG: hypothetical protein ACRBBV_02785 [Paracoccaceae bacterium]